MKRVFIIHGWDGVPNDAWKPWLKKELEKRGFQVIAPQMPGGSNPKLEEWLMTLSSVVGEPSKSDYFVGHSLGCIAILKYIETLQKIKIGGCVLVSGFITSLRIKETENFFEKPLDFRVNRKIQHIAAINSDNDPYVSIAKANEIKDKLGAKLIIEHGLGHISKSSGVKELPSALNAILEMAK